MMEASSQVSVGSILGSLKASSLADVIDPCFQHSQEGCKSQAFLVPESLLLASTHTQPPNSRVLYLHRWTPSSSSEKGKVNSEIQKLVVAFEQPVIARTNEVEEGNRYYT